MNIFDKERTAHDIAVRELMNYGIVKLSLVTSSQCSVKAHILTYLIASFNILKTYRNNIDVWLSDRNITPIFLYKLGVRNQERPHNAFVLNNLGRNFLVCTTELVEKKEQFKKLIDELHALYDENNGERKSES